MLRSITFNKRRYKVIADAKLEGLADVPERGKSWLIYVDPELKPTKHLEAAIHEALHAAMGVDEEAFVTRVGREIANFLWRLGYRREVT